jgi:hypothetical protein
MARLATVAFVARTSVNNHSNSKDRKRTSHALASPLGGAANARRYCNCRVRHGAGARGPCGNKQHSHFCDLGGRSRAGSARGRPGSPRR